MWDWPVYEYGADNWSTFEQGISKEWLITNGIGGFASSTAIGANSRRYHGLLVASLCPPARRHLAVSKLDESILIYPGTGQPGPVRQYDLFSGRTTGHTHEGFRYLQRFRAYPIPEFTYSIGDIYIAKSISMVHGRNTCAVVYRIYNGKDKVVLKLAPLLNFRDYHFNSHRQFMNFSLQEPSGMGASEKFYTVKPENSDIGIRMYCSSAIFKKQEDNWFMDMYYPAEAERGLDAVEDHYIPGYFEVNVKPGEYCEVCFIATTENGPVSIDGIALQQEEIARLSQIARIGEGGVGDTGAASGAGAAAEPGAAAERDWFISSLLLAADSFIVKRESSGMRTILAGYPWFTDWGRDAMIALPGLTLATGRYDAARDVLLTFAGSIRDGLVPNMFPDDGGEPVYNSADASLWFIEAVAKYVEFTGDYDFVKDNLYVRIREIIDSYAIGTHSGIGMCVDGLIEAGDENTQLTWMDAKVAGKAVTPRHGKPVELNALWYNALMVASAFAARFDEGVTAGIYSGIAEKTKKSFENQFWNPEKLCLYDVVSRNRKDDSIRPNQIIALSLTNPVVTGDMAGKIILTVWDKLYATYGLRSIERDDPGYKGVYTGRQDQRDAAYHNGTAWTWILGHFITAWARSFGGFDGEYALPAALRRFITPFMDHMRSAGIGSISEIFDGDGPFIARGCISQAWSVAEIFRVCIETGIYKLKG